MDAAAAHSMTAPRHPGPDPAFGFMHSFFHRSLLILASGAIQDEWHALIVSEVSCHRLFHARDKNGDNGRLLASARLPPAIGLGLAFIRE